MTPKDNSRLNELIDQMKLRDVRLNVITLDFANELGQEESEDDVDDETEMTPAPVLDPPETRIQSSNKALLLEIISRIKGAVFPAKVAIEVCKQFKKREVMARTRYRGNFDLAQDLKVGV